MYLSRNPCLENKFAKIGTGKQRKIVYHHIPIQDDSTVDSRFRNVLHVWVLLLLCVIMTTMLVKQRDFKVHIIS